MSKYIEFKRYTEEEEKKTPEPQKERRCDNIVKQPMRFKAKYKSDYKKIRVTEVNKMCRQSNPCKGYCVIKCNGKRITFGAQCRSISELIQFTGQNKEFAEYINGHKITKLSRVRDFSETLQRIEDELNQKGAECKLHIDDKYKCYVGYPIPKPEVKRSKGWQYKQKMEKQKQKETKYRNIPKRKK